MTLDILLSLVGFSLVTAGTPGPNNVMLLASGANFGFRRTIPHMFGIACGCCVMILLVGLGLAALFEQFPVIKLILTILCSGFIVYMAWKIARAGRPKTTASNSKPISFLQAAAFQWINPKAWMIALTVITLYAQTNTILTVTMVAVICAGTMPFVSFVWTLLGTQIGRILTNEKRLRTFNVTMAVLLLLCVIPLIEV